MDDEYSFNYEHEKELIDEILDNKNATLECDLKTLTRKIETLELKVRRKFCV